MNRETEDDVNTEENVVTEKQPEQEDAMSKENKDVAANDEAENKEEEKVSFC